MKLIDLLEAIRGKEWSWDTTERIQICEPGIGWDDFSEFHAGSQLLKPFADLEVAFIGSVAEDVIRVSLYDENFRGVKGYFPMRCMVGDMVYCCEYGGITEYKITGYSFGTSEDYIAEPVSCDQAVFYYSGLGSSVTGSFAESMIGETVFLTYEEAEVALERRKKGE